MSQTGTSEGDHLLSMIRQLVHGRVPPMHEEIVVEIVARTVMVIFSDPNFYGHLKLVQDLQSRILQMERVIALYQQGQMPARKVVVKKAAKRLPTQGPSKRAAPNVKQFRQGSKGR